MKNELFTIFTTEDQGPLEDSNVLIEIIEEVEDNE